ncbi:MAG: SUMF1/EgtB/PvdO family nonheme iron enzyme [Chloroflexi bacterium]|nr:SUMF1/EgtB/PvdO family nonheme iron enzyme [Chloroflexota bacterium]
MFPRTYISWQRAMIYCEARGARLPSEAEWEYAASGPDKLSYPWGNEFDTNNLHLDNESYPSQENVPDWKHSGKS